MFCKHQNILVAAYYHYKKIDTERKNHLKIGALSSHYFEDLAVFVEHKYDYSKIHSSSTNKEIEDCHWYKQNVMTTLGAFFAYVA